MDKNKHVVIDMGSSRISVMAVEMLESGEVRILSEESKKSDEIRYGVVEQASKAAFTINELTRLLQNSAHLSEIPKVCVSLNAKTMKQIPVQISSSLGSGRIVTESLLDSMAEECQNKFNQPEVELFDIIPLYYELDDRRTDNPVNQKGYEITAYYNVIVGSIYITEELRRCFNPRIPVSLEEYLPLGMEALSIAVLEEEDREAGCALINFGATTTTLAIYAEGVLQELLVVPLGAKNITRDIQELGISENNAEKLKCLKGSALESNVTEPMRIKIPSIIEGEEPVRIATDFLATIIESRLTESMVPIFKAIENCEFELENGIVITGGGAKLNDIADFISKKTGMEARIGDHTDWLSEDTDERFYDPIYAQSVGTALLLHDYKLQNPEKEIGTQAQPPQSGNTKKKFADKIADRFLKLFEDENYLK